MILLNIFTDFPSWLITILTFGFGGLLGSYLSQKGKNLATKEDIEAITTEVETVKTLLGDKSHFKRWRIEREHKAHVSIWEQYTELKDRFWFLWSECSENDCGMESDDVRDALVECIVAAQKFQELYVRYSISMADVVRQRLRPLYNTMSGFLCDMRNPPDCRGNPPDPRKLDQGDDLVQIIREYYASLER